MFVYKQTEPGLYTVGFYSPDGEWHSASDHESSNDAANRVHWLNGGLGSPDAVSEERFQALEKRVNVLDERANKAARSLNRLIERVNDKEDEGT